MRTLLTILFLCLSFTVSAQVSNININQPKYKSIKKKKNEQDSLQVEDSLMDELYKKKLKEIDSLINILNVFDKNDIDAIVLSKQKAIDSLRKEENKFKAKINLPKTKVFFPSMVKGSEEKREQIFKLLYNDDFNKTAFVKSFYYIKGNDSDIVQSTLLSDNLGAFLVSFGTVLNIENKKDDNAENKQKQNVERLLSAGGNFYLNFELPVLKTPGKVFTYYNRLNLRMASDIEGFGNDIETSDMNASVGMSNYLGLTSDKNIFNLFLLLDSYLYFGTNDFMQNVGVNSDMFFNTNLNFGITMDNKYRLFFRTNFASEPSLRTEKIAVGLQLIK